MAANSGARIVEQALTLAERHPGWPALQVLDAALDPHVNTHPNFETGATEGVYDWLDPPSDFAHLLRSAFAVDMKDDDFTAESQRWQDVIDAFAQRYHLWC